MTVCSLLTLYPLLKEISKELHVEEEAHTSSKMSKQHCYGFSIEFQFKIQSVT